MSQAQPLSTAPTLFFAHQGGWDEFLLVAAPLGVIGVLLWIANKRVSAKLEEATADESGQADRS